MMLSVYHTLFQHYALMFLQELQFTGGKRCFCSWGQFGYRKLLYYKGFPGVSTPVFMVSVCSSVKIKGRDCGTINGHDESSSIRTLMKDAREVLVR